MKTIEAALGATLRLGYMGSNAVHEVLAHA